MASDIKRFVARSAATGLSTLAFLTLFVPSIALAEPTAADRETARSLMDDGDTKAQQQDFQGALQSYKAADAIMRVPTTAIEVAHMQRKLGLLVEALDTLAQIQSMPTKPGEPAPFVGARKEAVSLSNEISAITPSITVNAVNVPADQTLELSFDGQAVPVEAAKLPRKVNPGAHTIVGKVGRVERTENVTVAERDSKTVNFNFDQAGDPDIANPDQKPIEPPHEQEGSGSGTSDLLFYGGGGLAIVGIGVGTVTGLMSLSKVSSLKSDCQQADGHWTCPPERQDDRDSASTLGTVSTIAFVAGGIGVAAAVIGLVTKPSAAHTAPPKQESNGDLAKRARPFDPKVRAEIGPSWIGLHGTF